ncbi:MAG: helix-hairpin-helix domain-containing protein [Candidatus Bipolaricaulia bacterium]
MKRDIGPERAAEEVKKLLDEIQGERFNALKETKDFQVFMRSLLQHEARRLETKLEKDHPRIRQLKARLKHNLDIVNDLEVELEIANIEPPDVGDDDLLIHGRVMDENHRGIRGLVVCMADDEGKTLATLGRFETDDSGYYSLVLDRTTVEKMPKAKEEGVFLTVCTKRDELIYRKPEPLKLTAGDRALEEVVLNREDLSTPRRAEKAPTKKRGREKRVDVKAKETEVVKLTDISEIGRARVRKLREAGIEDVKAFTEADEAELKEILGDVNVRQMKAEAASLLKKIREASRESEEA